jgi:hypoxanthine phosphoribosyltransferase
MQTTQALEVLLSPEQVQQRVADLGAQISQDYAGKELVLVGVLHGALVFLADLMRAITLPVEIDTIQAASYGDDLASNGALRLVKDLSRPIESKHVLIVEDVVDTELTLRSVFAHLAARGPASLKVCTLLDKQNGLPKTIELAYLGFTVPDRFVAGYGIDAQHRYRNVPGVVMLPEPRKVPAVLES